MRFGWLCSVALIVALAAICHAGAPTTQPSNARPELSPPPQRWTQYPAEVTSVCFDRQRRPWFMLSSPKPVAVEEIKQQVEQAQSLTRPWVEGAQVHLFDSSGRIWLEARPQALLAYD